MLLGQEKEKESGLGATRMYHIKLKAKGAIEKESGEKMEINGKLASTHMLNEFMQYANGVLRSCYL